MATRPGNTALAAAMKGSKVSERQAQSALGQAVERIAGLTKRARDSRETMVETGTLVMHTAETQGSLFLSSMAEGYLGEEKLKLGSVDVRAPIGLLAQGYGLYETMSGRRGSGAHVLALGNGIVGSWLASVARNAGQMLAEKRSAAVPSPTVMVQGSLLPEPLLSGPVREVMLSPEASTEGDDFEGRRFRPARRPPSRFVRARHDDEDDSL